MTAEVVDAARAATVGPVGDVVAHLIPAGDAASPVVGRHGIPGRGAAAVADARRGVEALRIGILRGASSVAEPTEHVLFSALEHKGVTPIWLELDHLRYDGDVLLHKGVPVGPLDAVIPRYVDVEPDGKLGQLQSHGVELLNDRTAVATTASKINSQLAFDSGGAHAIPTRFASSADDADAALHGLPDNVVVKPYDGESGHGVEFFTSHAAARAHIRTHFAGSDTALSVQPRVEGALVQWKLPDGTMTQSGMDYRVLITLDEHDRPVVDTVFQRIGAPGSGKSNIDSGGWGRVVPVDEVPQELLDAALAAHASIPGKYAIAGVDIIPVGRPLDQAIENHAAQEFLVTEVNSSPGIPDLNRGTHFADAIADRAITVGLRTQSRRAESGT